MGQQVNHTTLDSEEIFAMGEAYTADSRQSTVNQQQTCNQLPFADGIRSTYPSPSETTITAVDGCNRP